MYELTGGKFVKLGKAKNPVELENKYNVVEKLRQK